MRHSPAHLEIAASQRSFQDEEPGAVSLKDVLKFLTDYRTTIGWTTVILVLLAIVYISSAPTIFSARAQILIDPQTPQPLRDRTEDVNISLDGAQVESQIAVLRSEKIAMIVAKQLDLFNDLEHLSDKPKLGTTDVADPENFVSVRAVMENMAKNLDVRRAGLSYAIDISYSSTDAFKAARIANVVAEAYVADQLAVRAQAGRQSSEWLEERIDKLRRQMNAASYKVQEFRAKRDYRLAPNEPSKDAAGASGELVTVEELESTAATLRKIYESYLQAYTEAVQRQSFPVANARVLTPATRPLAKSYPKISVVLPLALLLGLLIGLALALVRSLLADANSQANDRG